MKISVKIEDQSYDVEVGDLRATPILATVDGQTYEVWTEASQAAVPAVTPATAPAAAPKATPIQPSPPSMNGHSGNAVVAPIPGVITSVSVQPNATVTAGQELCRLEAMKMNNIIRAPRNGEIASIAVTTGQQVRQKQVLMEYAS